MGVYNKILKKYSDMNPERFNKDFIYSKNDDNLLEEITEIFKQLEAIPEIHIENITLNTDEVMYGPIKQQGKYYKSVLESRLSKIHYKVKIDGLDKPIEKDMFLPKMMDNCFYINEGVLFYPIWQVVDTYCYSTNNGVSLKSLMLPVTFIRNEPFNAIPEFSKPTLENVPNYKVLLFSKQVSPLIYLMCKFGLDSLNKAGLSEFEDLSKYQTYQDPNLINELNKYLGIELKFDDDKMNLIEDGRTIFTLSDKKATGLSFSIRDEDLQTEIGKIAVGMILSTRQKEKKNKVVFTKENFITPWYWIDLLIDVSSFSKSNDPYKRLAKVKGVYVSLDRIIDSKVRKTLPIPQEDKENIFTIFRNIMVNFKELFNKNSHDLHNKRIRLYEYILYPLRFYFSQHINRLINQQINKDAKSIEKIFTSLTPMFLIKNLITSQLLRTYNSTNDFNLFSSYITGTFKGPQALGQIAFDRRSIDQSYVGRIDLVAASPGDPGASFSFSPFVKTYDGYFDEAEYKRTK